MKKALMCSALALSSVLLLGASGCQEEKFIERWSINQFTDALKVTATFSQNYEASLEGEIWYKNYGSVNFYSDSIGRFTVDIILRNAVFGDTDLTPTGMLPTGGTFPSIVMGPLYYVVLSDEPGQAKIIGYFDSPAGSNNGQSLLVGLAIQLQGVNHNFPSASITQNYFHDNRKASSFTIYGPKLDSNGNVEIPGGIFLAADLKAVQGIVTSQTADRTELEVSKELSGASQTEIRALIDQALKSAEKAGVLKRR